MSLSDQCGAGNVAKTEGSGTTESTALYWMKRSNWRASRSHNPTTRPMLMPPTMMRPTMTRIQSPRRCAPLICLHWCCQRHKPPIPLSPALIRFSNGLRSSALPMTQPPWLRGCNDPGLASTCVGRRYRTIDTGPSDIVNGYLQAPYRGKREGGVGNMCRT